MNTLSIIIYLASVLPSLKFVSVTFLLASLVTVLVLTLAIHDPVFTDEKKEDLSRMRRGFFKAFLTLTLLAVILPNKETVYMIAASEMGETVITSEEGKETFNLLKENVDQYLRDNLKGDE